MLRGSVRLFKDYNSQCFIIVTPGQFSLQLLIKLAKADYSFGVFMILSTGCHVMASLLSYQRCSPAEVLHPSQGETTCSASRASNKRHSAVWYLAFKFSR